MQRWGQVHWRVQVQVRVRVAVWVLVLVPVQVEWHVQWVAWVCMRQPVQGQVQQQMQAVSGARPPPRQIAMKGQHRRGWGAHRLGPLHASASATTTGQAAQCGSGEHPERRGSLRQPGVASLPRRPRRRQAAGAGGRSCASRPGWGGMRCTQLGCSQIGGRASTGPGSWQRAHRGLRAAAAARPLPSGQDQIPQCPTLWGGRRGAAAAARAQNRAPAGEPGRPMGPCMGCGAAGRQQLGRLCLGGRCA